MFGLRFFALKSENKRLFLLSYNLDTSQDGHKKEIGICNH